MTTSPSPSGLVALVGDAPHTRILLNALTRRFGPFPVILEAGEPSATFWARRKRQLGPLATLSLRASALPIRLTKPFSARRLTEILARPDVSLDPIPEARLTRVPSVNSEVARDALRALSPRAVFVCSTRMIGAKTLGSVSAPFINYHSGINPAYRGLYGGYHARARRDEANFGTTLHLVDKGVDTGAVLARHIVPVSKADNFHSYVPLMAVESRQIVCDVMTRALEGDLAPAPEPVPPLPSRQWYGPGVVSYLATGLIRGVW
jgi:hypothetical protein